MNELKGSGVSDFMAGIVFNHVSVWRHGDRINGAKNDLFSLPSQRPPYESPTQTERSELALVLSLLYVFSVREIAS